MLLSIGDLSQSILMKRQITATKTALGDRSNELATGTVADTGRHLRGDMTTLAAIDTTLARLAGHRSVAADAALVAQAQQTALGQVASAADAASARLLAAAQGDRSGVDAAAKTVAQDFGRAIAALGLRLGDRALFAGTATDGPALAPVDTIVTAAMAAISGAASADQVMDRLESWMADSAGFRAAAYRGGDPAPPRPVAPGEDVTLDITAADPALQDSLRGLLAGALLAQGALSADPAARAALARSAGETLAASATDRAHLTGRLGQTEARIAEAQSRIEAETASLGIARAGLVAADPYEAATALEEARLRLETLYTLTARISRLSLADYL